MKSDKDFLSWNTVKTTDLYDEINLILINNDFSWETDIYGKSSCGKNYILCSKAKEFLISVLQTKALKLSILREKDTRFYQKCKKNQPPK